MRYFIIFAAVPYGKAERIMDAAKKAGSFGGTVFTGRHISSSGIAVALGLGNSQNQTAIIVADEDRYSGIFNAIIEDCTGKGRGFGEIFSLCADNFIKNNEVTGERNTMEENENELITVIVNKGFADDAMAAARKAGAGGGTVVHARGTAREDDEKFFGMHIVPDKEMLLIVVPKDRKDQVLDAVKNLPCLQEKGSGVVFCSAVKDFSVLGKK